MTKDQFYIGQRVKQKDPDEGYMVYGRVKEIRDTSILIDWDDPEWGLMEDVEHFEDEYNSIKDGSPTSFGSSKIITTLLLLSLFVTCMVGCASTKNGCGSYDHWQAKHRFNK